MHRFANAAVLVGVWVGGSTAALAQDCDPLRPSQPIDTEVRNITEAHVDSHFLYCVIPAISIECRLYPKATTSQNPDNASRWSSFIYMLCTLLRGSSLSDSDKINAALRLAQLSQQNPPEFATGDEGNPQSRPVSGSTSSTLFQDDFDADVKPDWNAEGTNFGMVNGELHILGKFKANVGDLSWDNYAVDFDLINLSSSFGIAVRRQDAGNGMLVVLYRDVVHACSFKWFMAKDGKMQEIVNTDTDVHGGPKGCVGHYRIEADGKAYKIFKDGSQVIYFANSVFVNGGIGVGSYDDNNNVVIDNFKVEALRR